MRALGCHVLGFALDCSHFAEAGCLRFMGQPIRTALASLERGECGLWGGLWKPPLPQMRDDTFDVPRVSRFLALRINGQISPN